MTDTLQNWHARNTEYLSVALESLRLRLTRLTAKAEGSDDGSPEGLKKGLAIKEALSVVKDFESTEPLPALVILKRRFALSTFEQEILLLCAAMELDTRISSLCASAQDDPNKPFPTLALALALFDDPSWDAISVQRPLRYWHLIEISRLTGQSLISCPVRGDERIINFIKGLNYLDERITRISSPFETAIETDLPESQEQAVDEIINSLRQPGSKLLSSVVQLVGTDSVSKQLVAQKVAMRLNLELINLPVELLPTQPAELEEFSRLWQRESQLLPIAAYIDTVREDSSVKTDGNSRASSFSLQRLLSLSSGIFLLSTREVRSEFHATSIIVEIKKPTPEEQRKEWLALLGEKVNGTPALLAGQFNLNVTTIREIAHVAGKSSDDFHNALWKGCIYRTSSQLDILVQKLELKATWDDIVLPEEAVSQLKQIGNQVRFRSLVYDNWGFRKKMNRGLGINALFVGESGTGKTMAAEVLANELNLNLYRIDLSGVVSKYIGETEKNLRSVFDAAENGGAILFFDEADALFGKRSEVKDSHDRYANIEINYLLQRMESYNGLAILATNKKSALDEAFTRRLRFIIHFPFPGIRERRAIVQKVFPPSVPRDCLDYDRLAVLNLTGGSYYNIAINAAFDAAEKGTAITMPIILSAARAELQKIERPIKESDFVWNE
jgi:hypothetical protein